MYHGEILIMYHDKILIMVHSLPGNQGEYEPEICQTMMQSILPNRAKRLKASCWTEELSTLLD